MPLAIPPELKKINPYVRRAEELDRDKANPESRLVAYYCRQYAVHTGIPMASSSPAAKTCLGHLLEDLEKEKPAMDNFTRDEASFLCRKFATGIFDKADEEDRNGAATKNTAKTFYAAASFLQILEQFEPEGSDENEEDRKRIIYAKWKSTEILKALKEGRTPTPGGYGQEEIDLGDSDEEGEGKEETRSKDSTPAVETVSNADDDEANVFGAGFDLPSAPIPPPVPPVDAPEQNDEEDDGKDDEPFDETPDQGQEVELGPPPAYPGPADSAPDLTFNLPPPVETPPMPAPAPKKSSGGFFGFGNKKPTGKATKAQISDATELTKFALAALEDKDADLAAERLKQALSVLGR